MKAKDVEDEVHERHPEEVEVDPVKEVFWEVCLVILVLLNMAIWPVLGK